MARKRVNQYEMQAQWSVRLAALAGVFALGLAFLVFRNFDLELGIKYSASGKAFYVLLGCAALALASSGLGFVIALNSAGQRMNNLSQLSWTGFFANAGILTLSACLFIFFWLLKFQVR